MALPKFRIVTVDMDGFCGRDAHPHPSDVGLIVTALAMRVCHVGAEIDEAETAPEILAAAADALAVWTCTTEDGRVLDLMDFEVEPA